MDSPFKPRLYRKAAPRDRACPCRRHTENADILARTLSRIVNYRVAGRPCASLREICQDLLRQAAVAFGVPVFIEGFPRVPQGPGLPPLPN